MLSWHRSSAAADGRARPKAMGAKSDLVVWLTLQPEQQRIYEVPALHAIMMGAHWRQGRALRQLLCALAGIPRDGGCEGGAQPDRQRACSDHG